MRRWLESGKFVSSPSNTQSNFTFTMSAHPLSPLPITPLITDIPPINKIYHPYVVAQQMSNNLVIYSHDIGRLVTIA